MRRVLECRRTFIALVSIGCLTALGLTGHGDVAGSIAMVSMALGAANATQAAFTQTKEGRKDV